MLDGCLVVGLMLGNCWIKCLDGCQVDVGLMIRFGGGRQP